MQRNVFVRGYLHRGEDRAVCLHVYQKGYPLDQNAGLLTQSGKSSILYQAPGSN